LKRRLDDHAGRLLEAGVDHLHAGVAQRPSDHLRATIVAIQARLGDQHTDFSLHTALLANWPNRDAEVYHLVHPSGSPLPVLTNDQRPRTKPELIFGPLSLVSATRNASRQHTISAVCRCGQTGSVVQG